jgi:hypothetical protein
VLIIYSLLIADQLFHTNILDLVNCSPRELGGCDRPSASIKTINKLYRRSSQLIPSLECGVSIFLFGYLLPRIPWN